MKNKWKVILFSSTGILMILVVVAATYINNVGYNNIKLMYKLNTTEVSIVQMDEEGHYLALRENSNELLRDRMEREGWQFQQQEGSGYFFDKDNKEAVVTTKIWNRNYVIYQVNDNVANIADE
ncbi:hypothetical protein [Paenibacillus sp. Marseille-Q4541]|uniref:hypothetical protein n=1 Tax=Paenibacillus sp. Marseille-Q4541 TaxID=2831522 RepID=UPI001BACA82B|nr:hypothetical protein [Paenibacillus sp. Marseille-Q4541]